MTLTFLQIFVGRWKFSTLITTEQWLKDKKKSVNLFFWNCIVDEKCVKTFHSGPICFHKRQTLIKIQVLFDTYTNLNTLSYKKTIHQILKIRQVKWYFFFFVTWTFDIFDFLTFETMRRLQQEDNRRCSTISIRVNSSEIWPKAKFLVNSCCASFF